MSKKVQSPTRKPIRNTYNLLQVKKLIGKKLLIPGKNVSVLTETKDNAKKLKKALLNSNGKRLVIITSCVGGILHVVEGIEKYLAVTMLSYSDIKKHKLENLEIVIMQYPHLKSVELRRMFK